MAVIRRNGHARPWPEGEPTRPGERCELSDLLVEECACDRHRRREPEDHTAQPLDLDFS